MKRFTKTFLAVMSCSLSGIPGFSLCDGDGNEVQSYVIQWTINRLQPGLSVAWRMCSRDLNKERIMCVIPR